MRRTIARGLLCLALLPGIAAAAPAMKVRGLLDLGLVSSVEGTALNRLTFGDSNFDPYRFRLFLDAQLSPNLELHVQTILHEGLHEVIRADGAYALWTPWLDRDLSLEAGKIPWPIGTYAPRTYSDQNAFVGTPLIYQYRTSLRWDVPALSVDQQVAKAGTGQFANDADHPYLPVVDERWWDVGAVIVGSQRPLEFSLGVMQGSPSWPSPGPDNTPGATYLGRLGVVPVPGVRFGVSGADGTWMPAWYSFVLPTGKDVRDYHETTVMADAEFMRGPFELRGEGVHRRWETALTGTLDVDGGYAEARWSLPNGAWLAARGEALRYSDVTTSTAVTRAWDDDVDRYEAVVGYRVTESARVKLACQRTRRYPFAAERLQDDLVAGSLSIRF
ncbi:MAG TPA: hypothetical protein VN896_03965 [Methylomirabilota bacterium]|nr:hypothetical protein [Methylomirabilota bacterium]